MSRLEERNGFDAATRLRLLESDNDRFDARLAVMRDEMHEGFMRCESDSRALRKLLFGTMASLITACLLLLVNVLVIGGA